MAEVLPLKTGKPFGVWVIFVLFFIGGLLNLVFEVLMMLGTYEFSGSELIGQGTLTNITFQSVTLINIILPIVGAMLLFRLKRASLPWFYVSLALSALIIAYLIFTGEIGGEDLASVIVVSLAGLGIFAAIILYVRSLDKKGILN